MSAVNRLSSPSIPSLLSPVLEIAAQSSVTGPCSLEWITLGVLCYRMFRDFLIHCVVSDEKWEEC